MNGTVRGRRLAKQPWWLAAILLLLWSLVVGTPVESTHPWQTAAAVAALDPECAPVPDQGQVEYGCSDLSLKLQQARLWLNKNKRGHPNDKLFTKAREYTANYAIAEMDDGTFILGFSDGDLHAEQRLLQQMRGQAPRVVWDPATGTVVQGPTRAGGIAKIYSEMEPCNTGPDCESELEQAQLLDKTTWSWKFNAARGASEAEREKIRTDTNNYKTGLKPIAIKKLFRSGSPGRIPDEKNVRSGAEAAIDEQSGCAGAAGLAQSVTGAAAAAGCPGGIDFTSVQLRYVSDGGPTGGNTYSFRAGTTPGKASTNGTEAIYDAFNALNVWMVVDPSKFWVNLNPDEPDRIIDKDLAATDVGHVLLQSDLDLKRSASKLVDPNTALGKQFWDRMAAAGLNQFCTRNWIVPQPATVREAGSELYILNAPLAVKSEADTFQLPGGGGNTCPADSKPAVAIYRDVILPELTRVVNESATYTELRRVYISRVAAEWYRQRMVKDGTAEEFGIDSNDVTTLESAVAWNPKDIFNEYVKELNATKYTTPDGSVVITGGVDFTQPVQVDKVADTPFKEQYPDLPTVVQDSVKEVATTTDGKNAYAGGADVVPNLAALPTTSTASSGSGGLPVTGAPIGTIAGVGGALILVGLLVLRRTRRVRLRSNEE